MKKKVNVSANIIGILLDVNWKKLFVTFVKFYIYSIITAVIFANMYMNGWSHMLGSGTVSYKEFWILQNTLFTIAFFGDMTMDIILMIISPTHTHNFKYRINKQN